MPSMVCLLFKNAEMHLFTYLFQNATSSRVAKVGAITFEKKKDVHDSQ